MLDGMGLCLAEIVEQRAAADQFHVDLGAAAADDAARNVQRPAGDLQ